MENILLECLSSPLHISLFFGIKLKRAFLFVGKNETQLPIKCVHSAMISYGMKKEICLL
jgi:hypothetical protein